MKKEILIAICLGFAIGLIITFIIYRTRFSFLSSQPIISPAPEGTSETSPAPTMTTQSLSIISPLDESIVGEGKVPLNGVTSPSSWVTILTEKGEKVIQADKKGSFETEIFLISGENEIEFRSISETDEETNKVITVVYSTAEI